jgi:hypothetical protein
MDEVLSLRNRGRHLQPDFQFKPGRPAISGMDGPFASFNTLVHNREAQACSAGIPCCAMPRARMV